MFHKNEFMKYATQHLGMSSMHLEKYAEKSGPVMAPNIQGFTPNVIEERQMNIVGLDVFSRLMMDRIIFMGTCKRLRRQCYPGTVAFPGVYWPQARCADVHQ